MVKNKNIFIVDDDELVAVMLKDHLEQKPQTKVTIFTTGEACIKNLQLNPDVIILDYQLNGVDKDASNGMEVLAQIKKIDSSIHVIMLSSQDDYGKALQTIVKGALEYVVKDNDAFPRIDAILGN